MTAPPKRRRGRPPSDRVLRPFMLRLGAEVIEGLVRLAAEESARGGTRVVTAQDVARRAIESHLRPPEGGAHARSSESSGSGRAPPEAREQPDPPRVRGPVRRALLQWPGGKWRLGPWITSFLPPHTIYVEPFGGAASVLLQKEPCAREVYNDLDEDLVNLTRVLQSEVSAEELRAQLIRTPFAKVEFEKAFGDDVEDAVERARRLIVRSFMGHGPSGAVMRKRTGFRYRAPGARTRPAKDWAKYPDELRHAAERLRDVEVENTEAVPLMLRLDGPRTLFYVDPPYLPATRSAATYYRHEMGIEQHAELLAVLRRLQGMVVLSGYPSDSYDRMLAGWVCHTSPARADGGRKRTECVWLNHACDRALERRGL